MSEDKFTLKVTLENERGSVEAIYAGMNRESLLGSRITARLLRTFEASIEHKEGKKEEPKP